MHLKDYLKALKDLPLEGQKKKIKDVCENFWY